MDLNKLLHEINLKAMRELKNYSQAYVADIMGITQSYYSRLESGSSKITMELLSKTLDALDVKEIHPLFNKKNDILETISNEQINYFELQKRMLALEFKFENLEREVKKINTSR